MSDEVKDHCGVFGIYGHPKAAEITYLGLFALQHRGEESAGICTSDGKELRVYKQLGLVGDIFNEDVLKKLPGRSAIGHVRYSTTGSSTLNNAQPIKVDYSRGQVAVAHNGNLVNAKYLRDQLEAYGSIFTGSTDSEIIVHLMAKPKYSTREESVLETVKRMEGAFTLTLLMEDMLVGVRDPYGFRPLCLGKLDGAWVLASENCALELVEAEFIREIEAGEVVFINEQGPRSFFPFKREGARKAHCAFEHVYFARPDSRIFGQNVATVRQRLGRILAKEHPALADIVIPVPDSGNSAALGYSNESGIPLAHGFTRNHYIGRTFINPTQSVRMLKVKIKLNPIRDTVEGKRVVVVDDSIVRGNTSRSRVKLLRKAGAKEVHMRISCPPHISPCYYGIDFPSKEELLASTHSMEEIKKFLDVESIGYLSTKGLLEAVSGGVPEARENFCTACWTGEYPTPLSDESDKFKLERKC
ncbi:MAG: amidophosphoribosyltransferase [Candidatus Omnitrophica bacterium]|nr:amidophosphoribosyltransferase [Candidatus Omnitrophota bacterium]